MLPVVRIVDTISSGRSAWLTAGGRAACAFSVWLMAVWLPAGDAAAQSTKAGTDRSFEVQLFQSAIGPRSFLTVETAEVPFHKQFGLGLIFNYQRAPFAIYTVTGDSNLTMPIEVVRNQVSGELTGAIGLLDRFQIGLALPLTLLMEGDGHDVLGRPDPMAGLRSTGIGDLRVEGKVRVGTLGPDEEIVFSAAPGVTLPTGNNETYRGDKTVTGRLRGLAELRRGDLRVGANLGVLIRDPSKTFAAEVGQQLLYGAAAEYRFHDQVAGLIELFGRSGFNRFVDANPVEVDAAMRVGINNMLSLTFGGGFGLVKGIGSPEMRGFVGASWTPDFRDQDRDGVYDVDDKCPDQLEDRDGFRDSDGCPELDNDNDGIPDVQDKCANEAEDLDQFEDEDGCPELDNDKDGVPDLNDPCPNAPEDGQGKRPKDGCPSTAEDADGDGINDQKDKCPEDPEDRDGFEDEDGCPEPDNDNDGVPDNFDACSDKAEDADGFEDDDGCPEADNDKDGFLDVADKCPTEAETLNGSKDDDGCPDPGKVLVSRVEGRIQVDESIVFVADKTTGKADVKEGPSTTVVALVALVLKGHPDIAKLRIEVRGDKLSVADSQTRAEAIVSRLVAQGIDAARLSGVGMGPGPARVDFLIETKATTPAPRKTPPPAPATSQPPPPPAE